MKQKTPPAETYLINHHVCPSGLPIVHTAIVAPEIKGGFVRFIDSHGIERWISGNVHIVRLGPKKSV